MNKGLAPPVEVDHMLIRVLLAIEKSGLRRDVRRALADCDVQIESVRQRRQLWEFVARGAGDLVVISASLLQPPVQEKIRVIKELPESPWVVVLTEKDNPSSEAQFLAVGCEAVLYGALPFDILKDLTHFSRASCLDTRRALLPEPRVPGEGGLNWPTVARFSWTKLPKCRCICR